jgi:WhiB family redox-sensing transcriptional regulator
MDRARAASICGGCPVARECLEWDLRSNGPEVSGVWGPLDSEDRAGVFLAWLDRRDGAGGGA